MEIRYQVDLNMNDPVGKFIARLYVDNLVAWERVVRSRAEGDRSLVVALRRVVEHTPLDGGTE